jgi:hypothetical protein
MGADPSVATRSSRRGPTDHELPMRLADRDHRVAAGARRPTSAARRCCLGLGFGRPLRADAESSVQRSMPAARPVTSVPLTGHCKTRLDRAAHVTGAVRGWIVDIRAPFAAPLMRPGPGQTWARARPTPFGLRSAARHLRRRAALRSPRARFRALPVIDPQPVFRYSPQRRRPAHCRSLHHEHGHGAGYGSGAPTAPPRYRTGLGVESRSVLAWAKYFAVPSALHHWANLPRRRAARKQSRGGAADQRCEVRRARPDDGEPDLTRDFTCFCQS